MVWGWGLTGGAGHIVFVADLVGIHVGVGVASFVCTLGVASFVCALGVASFVWALFVEWRMDIWILTELTRCIIG